MAYGHTDPNWIFSHDLMKYDYAAYKSSWEDHTYAFGSRN